MRTHALRWPAASKTDNRSILDAVTKTGTSQTAASVTCRKSWDKKNFPWLMFRALNHLMRQARIGER
jgi:hypothetical protein